MMYLYSALKCIVVHTKHFTIMCGGGGGSLLNYHQCAASIWKTWRSPCVGAHQQHIGDRLYQPPRRSALVPPVQAGAPDPCMGPRETLLIESGIYPWAPQYGSRHPVETGAEALGMDAPPRCGEANLESVWPGSGEPLCYSEDSAMSPLVLPLGLDALVQTWPRLRLYAIPPIALLPGVLVAPFWPVEYSSRT